MKYGVLDPGHYKLYNNGIIPEYWESVSNLNFCKKLKKRLESTGEFKIILTRYDENDISLSDRGRMAKDNDFFLSVHSDSAGNTTGSLVIDSVDLKTEVFADNLSKACAKGYRIESKAVREREYKNTGEDYYTVMDKAQDIGCPLVHILERANHSNKSDCLKLMDEALEDKAVELVAQAYINYYGIVVTDWKEDLINWGLEYGIIKQYHKPEDIPKYWEIMAMFKNYNDINNN